MEGYRRTHRDQTWSHLHRQTHWSSRSEVLPGSWLAVGMLLWEPQNSVQEDREETTLILPVFNGDLTINYVYVYQEITSGDKQYLKYFILILLSLKWILIIDWALKRPTLFDRPVISLYDSDLCFVFSWKRLQFKQNSIELIPKNIILLFIMSYTRFIEHLFLWLKNPKMLWNCFQSHCIANVLQNINTKR